jgi:hypothetical protein
MNASAAICWAAIATGLTGCTTTVGGLPVPPLPQAVKNGPEQYLLVTVHNEPAPLSSRAGSTLRGYDGAASYAVSGTARALAHTLAAEYRMEEVSAWPIAALHVHCIVYHVPSADSRDELLHRLEADPRVELAQPLQSFATSTTASASGEAPAAYNDPYLKLQRGLWEMSVVAAHNWSRGAGASVAIIDTGVDTDHPDLAGRVRLTRNFVDHDHAQFEHDRHGTQVAGVIAAVGDNGQGIVGVAPQVQLLAYKACWESRPEAVAAVCNSFTLALALQSAIDAQVDVINLSLVGPADKLLAALTEKAIERGTIVVGAVSPSSRMDGFPSGIAGVLGVDMAERESRATGALRAPGVDVLTLTPEGHYDFATGSSLAAASVSGIVALMRSSQPHTTTAKAHDLLAHSMRGVSGSRIPIESINACTALSSLLKTGRCPDVTSPAEPAVRRVVGETAAANR